MDLASGTLRESVGRVRVFRVFWRVVQDRTSDVTYLIIAPFVQPSSVAPGTQVIFRAALRSRLVLSLRRAPKIPSADTAR